MPRLTFLVHASQNAISEPLPQPLRPTTIKTAAKLNFQIPNGMGTSPNVGLSGSLA
jgi:hypothetical protein